MSERYRIRAGVSSDVAALLALDRATELLPHWPGAEYAEALRRPCGDSSRSGVKRCLFMAETPAKLVGFIVASVTVLPGEVLAELESVAVAASERRSGIARALCESAIEWSRREGASEMDLEVRGSSHGAIALYRALGFSVVGRRGNYYRDPLDDAVLMWMLFQEARGDGLA